MILRVTSPDTDPWEGSVDEFLDAQPDIPKLVQRRIETLEVNERVHFDFPTKFTVERIS